MTRAILSFFPATKYLRQTSYCFGICWISVINFVEMTSSCIFFCSTIFHFDHNSIVVTLRYSWRFLKAVCISVRYCLVASVAIRVYNWSLPTSLTRTKVHDDWTMTGFELYLILSTYLCARKKRWLTNGIPWRRNSTVSLIADNIEGTFSGLSSIVKEWFHFFSMNSLHMFSQYPCVIRFPDSTQS